MKKKLLVLAALLAGVLTGCNNKGEDEWWNESQEDYKDQTVLFYLDYSHSDKPIYSYEWYTTKPMGEIPEGARLTSADAADPLFPVFLGYSIYPSTFNEEQLWDFTSDHRLGKTLELYGIWASND